MKIFTQDNNILKCRYQSENLFLVPWGKNALRVVSRKIQDPELPLWALLKADAAEEACIELGEDYAAITVGKLTAKVTHESAPDRLSIAYYNQKGEKILAEREGTGALKIVARQFKANIGGDYQLTASFQAADDEKLYGMGQYQQEVLNVKGSILELAHRNSQASVPFVLSSKGYGFLWHNPAIGKVVFGNNYTEWTSESTKQLDYWITAGDTPKEIESAYAEAVGHAPVMPEYGLGFWQCKLRYWNQEQLLRVAREYHRRGIHVDVIVIDFFHWPHMGDYRFEDEFWPDPKAMVEELSSYGMKVMVSIWPQVSLQSENFHEMLDCGYLVNTEKGIGTQFHTSDEEVMFFDFTNPEARKYIWEKIRNNYYKYGIETYWLDEAEPEYTVYDFENFRYYSGTVLETGNLYPQAYARAFYEGQMGEGQKEAVNLLRCAWAGSARYGAVVWSGDVHSNFPTLRRQVCAGLNMGIAGIPWWTTDIGGFVGGDITDPSFKELLVRWFQWGTFCPVMRLHGTRKPRDPEIRTKDGQLRHGSGADNEIWSYGEENYEILKKHIEFRELMRDYTRSLMNEAHELGTPVIRGMFLEFPEDKPCWDLKDQYMFGPDVLVAPVMYEGMREREVYLPAGASWTELHTGKCYEGGTTVTVDAPIEYCPVFIRDGKHPEWIGRL